MDHDDEETWKVIKIAPGYEVSSFGRIRRKYKEYTRPNSRWAGFTVQIKLKEKIINGWIKRHRGKPSVVFVALRHDGITIQERIHRLVLTAFVGPAPEGLIGLHNDGNALNNRLDNLRWGTQADNMQDAIKHGTKSKPPHLLGERHPFAKTTVEQVRYIRSIQDWPCGKIAQVARELGVHRSVVRSVRSGKTWSHIDSGSSTSDKSGPNS